MDPHVDGAMSWLAVPHAVLGNPAFYFTFAVIQAGVLLVLVRYLDVYGRQPFGLVALVAAWGATGAAAISVVGNEFVKGLLSGDVRVVFGDALSAPLVEEAAKGIALLAAVGPVRWLLRRAGVNLFEGVGAGVVYGAAVGLGFGFTEDLYYLVDQARTAGIDAGFDTFLYRRDFFGPAILHHAVFTAAFGAGLGLATWSTGRVRKILFPAAGFGLAVLMHAVNNGLVELVLVLKYGVGETARWIADPGLLPAAADTAATVRRFMRAIDFYYLAMFFGVIVLWTRRQRRVIRGELEEEVELGLLTSTEHALMFDAAQRTAADWRLVRTGQLERLRHHRRLRRELGQLGLLKWRTRRFGGDVSRVNRARREIATLSTYEVAPVKLPVPPSRLIGRERALEEIAHVLLARDVRVLTLIGPGGTGKTRLAIEVASLQRDLFAGGVYFVQLASLSDPDLVPKAIADVLEVQVAPGESVVAVLADRLRDKQLLLVLDNFEQVTDAAASVAEILRAAGRVKVLATSRAPLRISGEHEFPVAPLELPEPGAAIAPAALAANAAVALFVDRAKAVDPEFELTDANAAAVAEICIGLDGLPLAIELAAARVNVLTPEAMLDRLGTGLQLLSAGARDLPARHQALRTTIDFSYDLLAASEQALFKRLGVFVDGASIDAVAAVCLDGDGSQAALDGLGSLRDKSLLRRQNGATGTPRFTMLATIREYALERLRADGELANMSERHASYFADLAEQAETHLLRDDQADWFEQLDHEVGNLRAVLQWSGETGHDELGLRVVGALPRFWSMRGLTDPPRWLSESFAREPDVSPSVRAKALFAEGYADLDHGDFARAETRFEQSAAGYEALDEPRGVAASLAQLAFLLIRRGETERAVEVAQESVRLARLVDDANVESVALSTLADGAARARDYGGATQLYEQSLALRRELGDRRNIANALLNLGRVALVSGEHERARTLLEQGLAMGREVADSWSISVGLASLGRLALAQGRRAEASDLLGQALELAAERGGKRLAAECLTALADAAGPDAPQRSARLFGAAEALCRSTGGPLSPIESSTTTQTVDGVRARLGDGEFTTEWDAGLALSLEAAIAFALARSATGSDGADRAAELGRLLDRVRDAISRYDAGDIDAFEVDDTIRRYVRATERRDADAATVGKPTDRRSPRP
jgi:predicted ATPase/RsiW-degrading membrane proteinase PrsW (M82 family)